MTSSRRERHRCYVCQYPKFVDRPCAHCREILDRLAALKKSTPKPTRQPR